MSTLKAINIQNPSSANVNMLTNSTGDVIFNGNVGIGSSSPVAKLDIGAGNLQFSGSSQRITGDFSNATVANRVAFQTSTVNGNTISQWLPNGTSTTTGINLYNSADTLNASILQLSSLSTESRFAATAVGSGSSLPMTFYTGGSESIRINASGNVGIGTTTISVGNKLAVYGGNIQIGTSTKGLLFSDGTLQTTAAVTTYSNTNVASYLSGPVTVGNLFVANTTVSTSTTTGALVVAGGAGIAGNVYAGGNLVTTAATVSSSTTTGAIISAGGVGVAGNVYASGNIITTATTKSVSTTTGALIVGGGASIAGNAYVGGNVVITSANVATSTTTGALIVGGGAGIAGSVYATTVEGGSVSGTVFNARTSLIAPTITANTSIDGGSVSGTVFNARTSLITNNVISNGAVQGTTGQFSSSLTGQSITSNTTITAGTGLTVTSGGASITGNLTITGNLLISGNINTVSSNVLVVDDPIIYIGDNNPANVFDMGVVASYTATTYKHTGLVRNQTDGVWTFFDNLVTEPTQTIAWSQTGLVYPTVKVGNINVASNTVSTSTITGAVINAGGSGIAGNLYVGGNIVTTAATVATSTTTGALIVSGGAGIAGNVYVGGNIVTSGSSGNISGVNNISTISINVTGVTPSTSTTTGAIIASGGVGVAGNVYASGNLVTTATTAATSTTTGALIVGGGAGIAGNVYVGGNINVAGTNSFFTNKVGIGTSSVVGANSNVLTIYGTTSVYGNVQLVNSIGNSGLFFADGTFMTTAATGASYSNTNVASYLSGPVVVGNLYVANTTVSTSTTTGAIVNAGGEGIAGNLYVGGNVVTVATTKSVSTSTGAIITYGGIGVIGNAYVGGNLITTATTAATSPTTGALIVSGGAGINGDLNVGSSGYFGSNGSRTIIVGSNNPNKMYSESTSPFDMYVGGTSNPNVNIRMTTTSININGSDKITSTSTTTGALIVGGGVGITGNAYVGGNVVITSANVATSTTTGALIVSGGVGITGNAYVGGNVVITSANIATSTTTGALIVGGGAGIAGNVYAGGNLVTTAATVSTSTTTGAIISSGGVGIAGNVYASGNLVTTAATVATSTTTGALIVGGGAGIAGNVYASGNLVTTAATVSTSTTTGAIISSGGVGIAGNLNVGGTTSTFTGNVGIGMTSPNNSLTVSRAGADVARFLNSSTNGGDWQLKIGGGGFEDRKFMIADKYSGADNVRMAIDSSGNVGFGTTSPSAPGGTINLVTFSNNTTIIKSQTSSTTTGYARFDLATGTANSYTLISVQDNTASPYFQLASGSGVLNHYYDGPNHIFRNVAGTARMTIDTAGVAIYGSGEGGETPVGNTIRAPSGAGTNIAGANLTITSGNGTGTGGSGNILFQTATAGSTGTSANTMATRLTIAPTGLVQIAAPALATTYPTISTTGTVGSITGSGPWSATITGMSSTTGLVAGSFIYATNGVGSLGGSGTYVVSGIPSGTSITFTATGGTAPAAGAITNILTNPTTNLLELTNSNGNSNYLRISQIRNAASPADWTTATTRIQQVTDITQQAYIDFNPINGTYGMAFGTGGSTSLAERMRINSSGNVGIGTSTINSGNALAVYGGNVIIGSTGNGVKFPDGTLQTTAAASTPPGGSGAGAVQYRTSAGAFGGDETKFYYDSTNYRLAIGASDTSTLTLNVAGNLPSLFNTKSGSDPMIIVGTSSSVGSTLGYNVGGTYGYLRASPGGNDVINWKYSSGGKVGINGIASPINALDVSGAVVIGSGGSYAGSATAPTDGLLVQGRVGLGTSSSTGVTTGNALVAFGGHIRVGEAGKGIYFGDGTLQTTSAAALTGGTFTGDITAPHFYGTNQSLNMGTDSGTNPGNFIAKSTGTGDTNLAGMSFYNDSGPYGVKMGIRADGYFGVGGYTAASWRWYINCANGDMTAAGNVTAYSDPRLKENFQRINDPIAILSKLDGGTFTWKQGIEHTISKAGKKDYGVLADQVETVMPEIVSDSIEIEGEKYKTVAYEKLVPLLIEAVKAQQIQLDQQKAEIEQLKSMIG